MPAATAPFAHRTLEQFIASHGPQPWASVRPLLLSLCSSVRSLRNFGVDIGAIRPSHVFVTTDEADGIARVELVRNPNPVVRSRRDTFAEDAADVAGIAWFMLTGDVAPSGPSLTTTRRALGDALPASMISEIVRALNADFRTDGSTVGKLADAAVDRLTSKLPPLLQLRDALSDEPARPARPARPMSLGPADLGDIVAWLSHDRDASRGPASEEREEPEPDFDDASSSASTTVSAPEEHEKAPPPVRARIRRGRAQRKRSRSREASRRREVRAWFALCGLLGLIGALALPGRLVGVWFGG